MDLVRQCIRFREMLFAFSQRELRQRYVGTVLGRPWPFLQPVILLAVYYMVFNQLLGVRLNDVWRDLWTSVMGDPETAGKWVEQWGDSLQIVVMCCGLVPWLMTAEFTVRSANTIMENGQMVKKVAFPAELLPISLLLAYAVNLMVLLIVFCGVVWIFTPFFSPLFWLLPFVVVIHSVFLLGLAYLLATVNVFVRDVSQLLPVVVNLWFFLTPIVYVKEVLANSEDFTMMWIFDWNPMAYLVDIYRWILVYPDRLRYTLGDDGKMVHVSFGTVMQHLGIMTAVAFGTLFIGYRVFMAKKPHFADEI